MMMVVMMMMMMMILLTASCFSWPGDVDDDDVADGDEVSDEAFDDAYDGWWCGGWFMMIMMIVDAYATCLELTGGGGETSHCVTLTGIICSSNNM